MSTTSSPSDKEVITERVKWQIGSSASSSPRWQSPETSFVFAQLSPIKHSSGWNNEASAPELENRGNNQFIISLSRLLCRCRIVLRQIRRSFSKMSELENELTSSVTSFLVTSPELPVMTTTLVIVFSKLGPTDANAWNCFIRNLRSAFLCFLFGLLVSFLSPWCPHVSLKLSSLQQTLILFQNANFSGSNSHSATERWAALLLRHSVWSFLWWGNPAWVKCPFKDYCNMSLLTESSSPLWFRQSITGRVKMSSKAAWTTWSSCQRSPKTPSWTTWRRDTWTTTSLYPTSCQLCLML